MLFHNFLFSLDHRTPLVYNYFIDIDWRRTMKRIILTGGGTAGHVTPNIALLPRLKELNYDIHYIGSYNGIEKELIEQLGIPYHGISSGKLRRYFSLRNFTDPFRVLKGFREAHRLIKLLKPDVIFSKGGFVSVPVVFAGKKCKVPTIIHESDMTPGLANKLSIPSATKVCCNFPETVELLPASKAVLTGSPIRQELLSGDRQHALDFTGLTDGKPVILIIGGSLGAVAVNEAVRRILPVLLKDFQVIHLCGKGKLDPSLNTLDGYVQYEYIKDELKDLFALSDIVISRAGANAICELLALRKPNLLIPLSANASRGDQILNARSFERQGFSAVMEEEEITNEKLLDTIHELFQNRDRYISAMKSSNQQDSIDTIIDLIESVARA
jgi:UDP-N-acetylglucosamine--N-acetylmuramyl-(pentapeptide) pyrophosphoryl-undecaprenol N-acetylglucosamine transferase